MRNKKIQSISCDWTEKPDKNRKTLSENKTRLFRYKGSFSWRGIRTEKYKIAGADWADVIRRTLIGSHGESAKFHLRYFEIAPDGFSSFEKHSHEHVVIGIRGKGVGIAGKKKYKIGFLDTLYIKPNEPHQFRNPYNEPFGFFCIVNAKRDRSRILG
jgi:ribulose-bisphosphate carboxylase large chain